MSGRAEHAKEITVERGLPTPCVDDFFDDTPPGIDLLSGGVFRFGVVDGKEAMERLGSLSDGGAEEVFA